MNKKTKTIVAILALGVYLAMFSFFVNILWKEEQAKKETSAVIQKSQDQKIRITKLSNNLGDGLWKVNVDSSEYLIYISARGTTMIKK